MPSLSRATSSLPYLVLFDIDGTLVRRSGPRHREALEFAAQRVMGVDASTEGIPTHGMLDTDILAAMLRREKVPLAEIREAMAAMAETAEARFLRRGPDSLKDCICPGARGLLGRLRRRGTPLLLVTGNFPKIGWRKLELAGLREFFAGGAFAGMASTRAGLARIAIRDARKRGWLNGSAADSATVALIGDAPSDIVAAHQNGIRSIAVSTGISTPDELRAHQPHLLVTRLSKLRISDLAAGQ
ncbi:MAG: haloacid dehalogenase-like hydrolase [Bryobacterales bacterium]|nr:haloacid dehalogenase-like hydrolase [Bryobacterales bacterium]